MVVSSKLERIATVVEKYTATYSDPITFNPGDILRLGSRDMEWPEFIWCTAPDEKSGWVHDSFFVRHGRTGVASRPYSAVELTVQHGAVLTIQEERGGWSWCRNEDGKCGWVPDKHLTR